MGFGITKAYDCMCPDCGEKRRVTGAEMSLAANPRCDKCGCVLVVDDVKRVAPSSQKLRVMTFRQLKAALKTADTGMRREIVKEMKDRTKKPQPTAKNVKGSVKGCSKT